MAMEGGTTVTVPETPEKAGLSSDEAAQRLGEFGPNVIEKAKEVNILTIAIKEITEPMILLLLAVGVLYSIWGSIEDAAIITVVILLLISAEVWNEYRAKKAINALSRLAAPRAKVIRDGNSVVVDTAEVVPGDVLIITAGTQVAADARVVTSYGVQADESMLTGESMPVGKEEGDALFAGTLVTSGEGKARVTATGRRTRMGEISTAAREIKEPKTPLQRYMKSLAMKLVGVALFFSVAIPLLGLLRGWNLQQMVLTSLSLVFATVPEELPMIITIVLGVGALQLSRKNFLVKKIKAAEVLGNATVILTDKTGTITENRMHVASVYPPDKEKDVLASAAGALSDTSASPTDRAIAERFGQAGLPPAAGRIVRQRSFGNGRKTRAVLRADGGTYELYLTGAPEEVARASQDLPPGVTAVLEGEARKGRRVVAVARKTVPPGEKDAPFASLEQGMTLQGLVSIEDPPRPGVKEAVARARTAGVRTIMVTGDHPKTAQEIAASVGIPADQVITGEELRRMSGRGLDEAVRQVSVFARTTPEDKYRLVRALRNDGQVVAVTGDGINDALALKGADIGIAMGVKGTDAAKEAADIVLADDNYSTITHGIFAGRRFFDNLSKGVKYYLAVKLALIGVFLLPVLVDVPFPFSPINIILLELFMDLMASTTFVIEPAERNIYTRPPRDAKRDLFDVDMMKAIAVSGLSMFAAVSLPYFAALHAGLPLQTAQTLAFTAWMVGQVTLAFVMRSTHEPLASLGPFSNKALDLMMLSVLAFLAVALGVPAVGSYLKLTPVTPVQLAVVAVFAFCAIFWQEIIKALRFRATRQA
ncbi:MAG: Copper-exporting P-type ATPase B [Methanocella sp. PtaU1.Bin125]|nr:MAG: Copper-exporting P-type ATPase B [Methanocella sp. PtaU1.Bin125]